MAHLVKGLLYVKADHLQGLLLPVGLLNEVCGQEGGFLYAAGGRGQDDFVAPGSDGAGWGPNNGSGGSGSNPGGDGQGGVFIWSYASPIQLCTGGTITTYLDGSTRWWVHTFTTSGTLVVP